MTDRIDIDELDTGESDGTDENHGDWFWRDDGGSVPADTGESPEGSPDAGRDPDGDSTTAAEAGASDAGSGSKDGHDARPVPHVPRPNADRPVGIPVESGGAGGGPERDGLASDDESGGGEEPAASGPHGGGVDDMTMAVTYNAFRRLEYPRNVVASANGWADWVGIVGRVDAPVLNKFQRDEAVDLDFFNGSGTGPGERLREIDRHSMFYAERMVVVGVEGEDEPIAESADWEFVPLSEAAEKADWELAPSDG